MNALLKGRVVYGLPSTTLFGQLKQASDFHMYSPDRTQEYEATTGEETQGAAGEDPSLRWNATLDGTKA